MDWTRREAMRWMSAAAGVGAVGGFGLPAWARRRDGHEGKTILPWTKLREGAWATNESVQGGNVLVVADDHMVLVVDTKFPHYAPALRDDAITLGHQGQPISMVLVNTHHHADHTAGNVAFHAEIVQDDRVADIHSFAHQNGMPRIRAQEGRYMTSLMNAPAAASRLPQKGRMEGDIARCVIRM
ncbi:MAG: MBL fold metallo-hydrolase, partial [Planctomycetota bacterium]